MPCVSRAEANPMTVPLLTGRIQLPVWGSDYDASMEFGSEDPADLSKTTRVLTIMLAEVWRGGLL